MEVNGNHTEVGAWSEHLALLGWDEGAPWTGPALRAARGRPITGTRLEWCGPGEHRTWELGVALDARRTYGGDAWIRLDGVPVVSRVRVPGRSFLQVGLRRSAGSPAAAAALRRMLIASSEPCAWLDLRGVVVLRMDDPGSCASVLLDGWRFDGLDETDYEALGEVARRHEARLSIGFTPAWVDDGDPDGSELMIDGVPVDRVAGAIHPSVLVRYRDSDGFVADGAAQYRGVEALRKEGLASVDLHGYTHVHPDRERWAAAESRRRKVGWYKEFAPENVPPGSGLPEDRVTSGLRMLAERFDEPPVALICPGHACTPAVVDDAYRQGLQMICAGWFGVRNGSTFMELSGVASTALEWPPEALLANEAPTIAWFHDRDIALHGAEWLDRALESWRRAGATRFCDLDELSRVLGLRLRLQREGFGGWTLEVKRAAGRPLARPFPVALRFDGPVPESVTIVAGGAEAEAEVSERDGWTARVTLPAGV